MCSEKLTNSKRENVSPYLRLPMGGKSKREKCMWNDPLSLDWKSAEHPRCTFPSSPCKISDSLKGFILNNIHKRSLSSKIPIETSILSKKSQGTLFNPILQLIPNAVFSLQIGEAKNCRQHGIFWVCFKMQFMDGGNESIFLAMFPDLLDEYMLFSVVCPCLTLPP